jgi:hypothetical protein
MTPNNEARYCELREKLIALSDRSGYLHSLYPDIDPCEWPDDSTFINIEMIAKEILANIRAQRKVLKEISKVDDDNIFP